MTLTISEFGRELLRTQDLDPVYVALFSANIEASTLRRLCLAYLCFYNLGFAAWAAEKKGAKFWDAMMTAAENVKPCKMHHSGRWPRAAERRHFRGAQATSAVGELMTRYKAPEDFCRYVFESTARPTFGDVTARTKEHRGFGEWVAFKTADLGERVLNYPVDFSNCALGVYKDPRQGAALARAQMLGEEVESTIARKAWDDQITDQQLEETLAFYVRQLRKFKAPPALDRPVGLAEVETCFCKGKSYSKGHYWVGKDIVEVSEALEGWGDLAAQLLRGVPEKVRAAP